MKKWFRVSLPIALFLGGAAYAADTKFVKSTPEDDSISSTPPSAFVLEFTEAVALHQAYIKKDNDREKPLRNLPSKNAKAITIPAPSLAAGHYVLEWSAFTRENIVLNGRIRFTVSEAPVATSSTTQ
jgi:methionine-rich copper-binding protein CopC